MKALIILLSFASITCFGQGVMLGTDDELLVAEGSSFKVISSIGEIPFDYVSGESFSVFVSRYNFNIGKISTSVDFMSPELLALKVYPNPFISKVHIEVEVESSDPIQIAMVNLEGKLIYSKVLKGTDQKIDHSIDLQALDTGQYFIVLQQADRIVGNAQVVKIK